MSIMEAINEGEDILVEKSRDLGWSWLTMGVGVYAFLFWPNSSMLYVSRKQDLVDARGNPDSLFAKADMLIETLPGWMKPLLHRKLMTLVNEDNGSIINGESTGTDTGRGGRRTFVALDEFAAVEEGHAVLAATGAVTNTRIFVSTPKGQGNAFAEVARNPNIRKITSHWSLDPRKNEGLERLADGSFTSPWYRKQVERASNRIEIAQELDIDYSGSDYSYFDPDSLTKYISEHCRKPVEVGELIYDEDCRPHGFSPGRSGRLAVWETPKGDGQYCIGVDIATGTGSSNSVISVGDRKRLTKVAEFVCSNTRPDELAKYAIALGRHYCGAKREAYMIWEANGPGRIFGDVIEEQSYTNFFFREAAARIGKPPTQTPGWYATKDTKQSMFGAYRKALHERTFINPSSDAINECREIIFIQGAGIAHARGERTIDPSGARENHADRPTADGLLWKVMSGNATVKHVKQAKKPTALAVSYAHRRAQRQREAALQRARRENW